MTNNALVPYEEHQVDFYGDRIPTVMTDDGAYAPVKPLCENVGIKRPDYQYEKIRNDEVLRCHEIVLPSKGGPQRTFCIHIDDIPMWLSGISAASVEPSTKAKLILYRKESKQALRDYWYKGEAKNLRFQPTEDLPSMAEQAVHQASIDYGFIQHLNEQERNPILKLLGAVALGKMAATSNDPAFKKYEECSHELTNEYMNSVLPIEQQVPGRILPTQRTLYEAWVILRWCPDKMIFMFGFRNVKELKDMLTQYGFNPAYKQKPTSIVRARQIYAAQLVYGWTEDQILMYYNQSRSSIQSAYKKAYQEEYDVFLANQVDWFDKKLSPSEWDRLSKLYWKSAQWYNKKDVTIQNRGGGCRCGVTTKSELRFHHLDNQHYGREAPNEVELICVRCHKFQHPSHDIPVVPPVPKTKWSK